MEEQFKTEQSQANVPYVEPTQTRAFLVKVKEVIKPKRGESHYGLRPDEIVKYRTLTIHSTSFIAAQAMVVAKGFTLAD